MRLLAPAKLNLFLRVGHVQADGFHPLVSWMTTIGLFDTIETDIATGEEIVLTCDRPGIPTDAGNLIFRAARLMLEQRRTRHRAAPPLEDCGEWIRSGAALCRGSTDDLPDVRGLKAHLIKRIPAGGGLGGGSSDAARMLLGLNRLLGVDLTIEQLAPLAAELGSDVPFFLYGPSSICRGRGEIVQPIAKPAARWATLALPTIAMPTPQVYKVFDALGLGKVQVASDQPDLDEVIGQEWTLLRADELLPRLVNDLERPAFEIAPPLGHLRADLEQRLGRTVRMSGSGSTLFTLFDEACSAHRASEQITSIGVESMVVELCPIVDDDLGIGQCKNLERQIPRSA